MASLVLRSELMTGPVWPTTLLLDEPDSAPGVGAHSTGASGDDPGSVGLGPAAGGVERARRAAAARVRWCGWWLTSTATMLGALYVSSPSPVLALMLTAALVPGGLLLGASRSELAQLERRWLAWRLLPG